MAVRFRIFRERTLPSAAYRIEPRFWTAAGRRFAEGLSDSQRRACKTFEPRVTGIAWTSRRLYLVIAAAAAAYEHAAQLLHARELIRADEDYTEHKDKRISLILLTDKAEWPIADFCRRHRVQVVVPGAVDGNQADAPRGSLSPETAPEP